MRKCSLYVLIALVLCSNVSFIQLLKTPQLIAHFIDHRNRDNALSLYQFLSMHYWGNDINDNDDQQDQQLPFKKIDQNIFQPIFFPLTKPIAIESGVIQSTTTYPLVGQPPLYSTCLKSLLKPPQA